MVKDMNYKTVMDDLKKYSAEEEYYRNYYKYVQEGKSPAFLPYSEEIPLQTIQYASNPESIDPYKKEADFFNTGRNIAVIKHLRYFPYFTHCHAFFEIIYVLSGHCQEITNDRIVELKTGDLCLLAPNITHGIKVFDDSIVLNILIRHSTFMDIFFNAIHDKSLLSLFFFSNIYEKNQIPYLLYHTEEDEIIRNYILDIYTEQMQPDDYSDRIMCNLLTIFFAQLTRRHAHTAERPALTTERFEYSDAILSYIINNYKTITLSNLAKHFHFSTPYCSKIVRSITGISFTELITEIKLQKSKNLLEHTQMSITEISDYVGYKNPETFIRSFCRIYHISPSQYRKNISIMNISKN